jgi:uncharacterized membrane protein YkoI
MLSTGCIGHNSNMRSSSSSLLRLALILAALGTRPTAAPGEEIRDLRRDHDLARQGQLQQAIIPLRTLIAAVRQTIPGDIAGIELERRGGNWLYEIKVISPKGVMIEVHIDARTGAMLPDKDK